MSNLNPCHLTPPAAALSFSSYLILILRTFSNARFPSFFTFITFLPFTVLVLRSPILHAMETGDFKPGPFPIDGNHIDLEPSHRWRQASPKYGTSYDQEDMERMGKKQQMNVSVWAHLFRE